jgi:ABC-type Na+ efflux pump permease subunit
MNPLVKKEIRLLLPAWTIAMLLAIVPVWFTPFWSEVSGPFTSVICQFFAIGFLLFNITSFGQELSSGSFASLLSLPMERRSIWTIKTTALAVGSSLILFAWVVSVMMRNLLSDASIPLFPNFEFLLLSAITMFSGALWTTLLLRQMVAAFALTLLIPATVMFWMGLLSDHFHWPNRVATGVLLAYSIGGFFWARYLFLRAQDTQWTGGNVFFSWRGKVSASKAASISVRPGHWLPALDWKEIQLQQPNLLIAALVLLLHLSAVFIRKMHPHFDNPAVLFMLQQFWMLWFLMPLLVGSAAIAEERRLGIAESQLSLSVSRFAQWFVKISVAFLLALLLGGVLPMLIEKITDPFVLRTAAEIFLISFYASSLARSTFQAIGMAMAFTFVAAVVYFYCSSPREQFNWLYQFRLPGPLHYTSQEGLGWLDQKMGPPIFVFIILYLSWWNFKWLQEKCKLWSRNLLLFFAVFPLIFVLSHAIYFRVWELFMPLESRGPRRLQDSSQVKFAGTLNVIYAALPDGRLWNGWFSYHQIQNPSGISGSLEQRNVAQFIGGSNWVAVAADNFQAVCIQSNGTLWSVQIKWNVSPDQKFRHQGLDPVLAQIGSDTNWSQTASGQNGFLLLKKDKSLWAWGYHRYHETNLLVSIDQKLKRDLASPPMRVSEETNWTGLYSSGFLAYARKNDGNNWMLMGSHIVQETNVDTQWSHLEFGEGLSYLEVKTNGELWLCRTVGGPHFKVQLGENMSWKMASFARGHSILALRSDGTLWTFSLNSKDAFRYAWKGPDVYRYDLSGSQLCKMTRLGNRSDWVGLPPNPFNALSALALASDGSLWDWNQPSDRVWLAPSRGPAYMGNIFDPGQQ